MAALKNASDAARAAVVDLLLSVPDCDPTVLDCSPLRIAVVHGLLEVVERLLADPRVDPSAGGNAALRSAAEKGHVAILARLLADPLARVDPAANDNAY